MNNDEKLCKIVARLQGEMSLAFILLCRERNLSFDKIKKIILEMFSQETIYICENLRILPTFAIDDIENYLERYSILIDPLTGEIKNLY